MLRERAREREPLALEVNKCSAVFIFIREIYDLQRENRSTILKEKVEGLWTGYECACYYFSENLKRSQATMLTSRKVYLACSTLGQEEEMGGLGSALGSTLHIKNTKIHVFITTFRLADFVWSTKLAHKDKRFPSPPLNVWFLVAEHKSWSTVPEQPTGCS